MTAYAYLRTYGDYPPSDTVSIDTGCKERTLGEAALAWARCDVPVFPLHHPEPEGGCSCGGRGGCNPGKHPRFHPEDLRNGLKNATTDPKQIRRWWSRWPDANIGVPTGAASGRFDVDVNKGGQESLDTLEAEHGKLPNTLRINTRGDNYRLVFNCPPGERISNSAGELGLGLDIRGDDGCVVAPPSLHPSGDRYTFSNRVAPVIPRSGCWRL